MTVKGARKALEAGASGIVVSNHGGRVLDQCPATAEVLPAIADEVGGQMKIFVDGGIRTGLDVLKALALGADGVLIGRPFVTMVYGGAAEGVDAYVRKLTAELRDGMAMCGVHSLDEITREIVLDPEIPHLKRALPFSGERVSLRSAPCPAYGGAATLHCAQSVICDVHAAANNGLELIRGLRAANSVNLKTE